MSTSLDQIPHDILQHIAFLAASSNELEPPGDLLRLLLTNSTIERSLNVDASPSLYANVFQAKFDFIPRLHGQLADSTLAAEYVLRCRLLRRARYRDVSLSADVVLELWSALRMVLEDKGRNDAQLHAVGFTEFIVCFALVHISGGRAKSSPAYEIHALTIWLLCLALSRR